MSDIPYINDSIRNDAVGITLSRIVTTLLELQMEENEYLWVILVRNGR